MSTLRQLVENDCGGLNPLMQLGSHFNRDIAHRDEGLLYQTQLEQSYAQDKQMVNEFLHQVSRPPQTFHVETLLQEIREIEQRQHHPQQQHQHQQQQQQPQHQEQLQHLNPSNLIAAPPVIEEITANKWSHDFYNNMTATNNTTENVPTSVINNAPLVLEPTVQMIHMQPQKPQITHVQEFFMDPMAANKQPLVMNMCPSYAMSQMPHPLMSHSSQHQSFHPSTFPVMYQPHAQHCELSQTQHSQNIASSSEAAKAINGLTNQFFEEIDHFQEQQQQQQQCDQHQLQQNHVQKQNTDNQQDQQYTENIFNIAENNNTANTADQWVKDFQIENEKLNQIKKDYNEKFWQHLRNEWNKLSEENMDYSWLSDYDDQVYNEYNFLKENPMKNITNALEKGKEYLTRGDIPSAVLCFEVAVQQMPSSAESWKLLGTAQAENEMDPQAINALKKAHELEPNEPDVLMALAICYTNESLQSHAVKMLLKWLNLQQQYKHLIPADMLNDLFDNKTDISSIIRPTQKLIDVQEVFLSAVRLQPNIIDPRLQEALGVLYNLSSDYDKAVDCFRTALQIQPHNAKLWNRLGASLANGNRSVEAIDAYQRALVLEPGFIRVRYNVGICCLNLKAYHQAVEHLIVALNMQANVAANRDVKMTIDQRPVEMAEIHMSQSIWSTLKMAVTYLGRTDLIEIIDKRNLDELNAEFREN